MRLSRAIELSPGQLIRLHELRLGQLRHLLGLLTPERLARPLPDLLSDLVPELLGLASDCLELPAGTTLDDLTCSELERLSAAWWEMHRPFLSRVMAVLGLAIADGQTPAVSSPAPASSSSAPDSPPPGSGAPPTFSPSLTS